MIQKKLKPNSGMDVPSSVYETVNKWRNEWLNTDTELSLFNWCLKYKK